MGIMGATVAAKAHGISKTNKKGGESECLEEIERDPREWVR
jgi:hypothetical protein